MTQRLWHILKILSGAHVPTPLPLSPPIISCYSQIYLYLTERLIWTKTHLDTLKVNQRLSFHFLLKGWDSLQWLSTRLHLSFLHLHVHAPAHSLKTALPPLSIPGVCYLTWQGGPNTNRTMTRTSTHSNSDTLLHKMWNHHAHNAHLR